MTISKYFHPDEKNGIFMILSMLFVIVTFRFTDLNENYTNWQRIRKVLYFGELLELPFYNSMDCSLYDELQSNTV